MDSADWKRDKEQIRFNSFGGISTNVLAKMNKGEYVSMESLHKICRALKCDIGDIVTFEEK